LFSKEILNIDSEEEEAKNFFNSRIVYTFLTLHKYNIPFKYKIDDFKDEKIKIFFKKNIYIFQDKKRKREENKKRRK
jgi:hypothetical protein